MMPSTIEQLDRVVPVYETLPGWRESIAQCKSYEELPENAQRYVSRIEEVCNCFLPHTAHNRLVTVCFLFGSQLVFMLCVVPIADRYPSVVGWHGTRT